MKLYDIVLQPNDAKNLVRKRLLLRFETPEEAEKYAKEEAEKENMHVLRCEPF